MKKPIILLFSDCFTFGGSEFVVINILKSKYLQSQYALHFAYRRHKEYSYYVNKLLAEEKEVTLHPLKLWSNSTLFQHINAIVKGKMLRKLVKFPFWILDYSGLYNRKNYCTFRQLLSKLQVDLIHINNGGYPASESCLYLAICAGELGIKNIFQVNNRATKGKRNKRDEKVGKSVSLFLTATNYARKELSSNRHFDLASIVTLYNAVEFPHVSKNRTEVCNEIGIPEDNYIITEVALLEDRKGQIPLLKALMVLKAIDETLYNKTSIIFVGDGENEKIISSFIEKNGLGSKVKMLGYRLDYVDIINASDAYALPSLYNEDMPLSILTAMSLSKPIISSAIAGIPEEVEDTVNGYLANPSSSSFEVELADYMKKVYNNKVKLGQMSLEKYKEKFGRDIYERKLVNIYNSIIEERSCE